MPELPEVEVTCQGVLPHLLERTVLAVHSSGKSLRQPIPQELLRSCLCNKTICTVERRAKYILIRFTGKDVLIIHLGMTGKLGIFSQATAAARHDHLVLTLDNTMELRYNDVRRFGSVAVWPADQAEELEQVFLARQGIEPLGAAFDGRQLHQLAHNCTVPMKKFFMDSRRISGIGNIYANEILFAAGIHPLCPANSLSLEQWQEVAGCTVHILNKAIQAGGSTISDFLGASGQPGYFQLQLAVYGKKGAACPGCGEEIVKEVVGGRATFFCPECQQEVQR
ncbi:MAG: bifunctional DNA-formamidopyrimidine glycosylase/DNA-(apurinic or apyrimidinic site) lyase [Candidatus Electrothrix sp. AW1]|nr:bifunctional DNA-formamidopyrimidine glycosylase/DNA-(apurinic or apyrimidinic site) lyase [Candidatus Electrothrix sp. AX1]MCI5182197.1 bifunctional DNA-formamidopyrimidine glycosylase/DNA-(apurinic or apyrimidinic site) lyase [Candidatus Electrothrix gigas]